MRTSPFQGLNAGSIPAGVTRRLGSLMMVERHTVTVVCAGSIPVRVANITYDLPYFPLPAWVKVGKFNYKSNREFWSLIDILLLIGGGDKM